MDLELPDGTVLEVPDDADPKAVLRGYRRKQLATQNPEEYDPSSEAYQDKYGPGGGKGLAFFSGTARTATGLGNLAGKMKGQTEIPRLLRGVANLPFIKNVTSNEAVKAQDVADQDLVRRHPIARIGGEMAASIPLSMATGGAGGASTALPLAGRALMHPTTVAAIEGVIPAMAMADTEKQMEGGVKGLVTSAIIERFLKGGGRLVRGLAKKSQAAKDLLFTALQHGDEIDLPLSQAAGDQDIITRLTKLAYQEGLPLIPGVKGKIERQSKDALERVREVALKEALPEGAILPKGAGKNIAESLNLIKSLLDQELETTVKSYRYNVPDDLAADVAGKIRSKIPDIDDTTVEKATQAIISNMGRFASGQKEIAGSNILKVKDVLTRALAKAAPEEQQALAIARDHVDDIIRTELTQGGAAGNLADLARYQALQEPMSHFPGLAAAAEAAKAQGGNFSMEQLARKATNKTQENLGSTAAEVFSEPAAKSSFTGRVVAGAGIGGFGYFMDPLAAGGVVVGGNLLATKTMQRALMGDTTAQRTVAKLIQDHPEAAGKIESAIRQMMAAQAGGTSNAAQ